MNHLAVYIPLTHVEKVKEALFAAGAGRLGHYDSCCWQTEGRGQFRPLKGSNPFIGKESLTEYVDEVKLELICTDECLGEVILALKKSHPYETPAYYVLPILDI